MKFILNFFIRFSFPFLHRIFITIIHDIFKYNNTIKKIIEGE